jgi:hypothetical protein
MMTRIRPTLMADLQEIMAIYTIAREHMCRTGNPTQWCDGYPAESFIVEEILAGHSFVCENEANKVVGTCCLVYGEDPTYTRIYEGQWLNDKPYVTLHRIASSGIEKGVAKYCIEWCFTQHSNIRVDTHRDNRIMQHILQSMGFTYCGIIFVSNGSERLAYQKEL